MALVSDADQIEESEECVTLMTLHIAKGLEFPVVMMVGLEEGLFPSMRSIESETGLEEERRLAYVGITRAEQKLFITYARSRRVWGSEQFNPPSRFLNEIPKEYLDEQTNVHRPRIFSNATRFDNDIDFGGDNSDPFPDYESGDNSFPKGSRVKHPTFGIGSILNSEGSGEMQKVSVVFSDHSVRKFVIKYARLERI